ncbi:MAG: hypothetical protein KAU16_05135 [Methanophagales archaeon]|nr:hypothetical protein [Methanophagales archaeon]
MEEKDFSQQIEKIKTEWHEAFEMMQKYYENEVFKSFKIEYDASTWYRFKNPALIFPAERENKLLTQINARGLCPRPRKPGKGLIDTDDKDQQCQT